MSVGVRKKRQRGQQQERKPETKVWNKRIMFILPFILIVTSQMRTSHFSNAAKCMCTCFAFTSRWYLHLVQTPHFSHGLVYSRYLKTKPFHYHTSLILYLYCKPVNLSVVLNSPLILSWYSSMLKTTMYLPVYTYTFRNVPWSPSTAGGCLGTPAGTARCWFSRNGRALRGSRGHPTVGRRQPCDDHASTPHRSEDTETVRASFLGHLAKIQISAFYIIILFGSPTFHQSK